MTSLLLLTASALHAETGGPLEISAKHGKDRRRVELALRLADAELIAVVRNPKVREQRSIDRGAADAIEAIQSSWRTAVRDECRLKGLATGAGTAWQSVEVIDCEATLMTVRLKDIRGVIRCLRGPHSADQTEPCFSALTRLAVLAEAQQR